MTYHFMKNSSPTSNINKDEKKEDYDEIGCSLNTKGKEATGRLKKGGTAILSNSMKSGNGYFHTQKILICASSGSGKTQLAFDLIYFLIGPFRNVIYINYQFDDKVVVNYERWFKLAGIDFYKVDAGSADTKINKDGTGGLVLPDVDYSVILIDDTYTSTGRNSAIEVLLKEIWNRGRHEGNHIIYMTQLDDRLPAEPAKAATQVWVDRAYKRYPVSQKIPEAGVKWYMMIEPLSETYGKIYEAEFSTPLHTQQIIERLKRKKNKLPPSKKEEQKKPTEEDKIGIFKAGNKEVFNQPQSYDGRSPVFNSTQSVQNNKPKEFVFPTFSRKDFEYGM